MKSYNLQINVKDEENNDAFLIAFTQNSIKVASFLLENGFSPNSCNRSLETALIKTVKANNFDLAEMLLEKGADPNI